MAYTAAAQPAPDFRLERRAVEGGAELLTVFGRLSWGATPTQGSVAAADGQEVPLISVLRDTLGDAKADNDRLRSIWVLTSARPSLLQRAAAFVPFLYYRPHLGKNADHRPVPVLDLGDTTRNVWSALARQVTQVAALDPEGAWIRSSTRSYQTNMADHRRVHLMEGLAVLSHIEDLPEVKMLLSEPELLEMQARLTLAGQTLGGLVDADQLPEAYFKQRQRTDETRGHNWELLRQRAETNGLIFEPLGLGPSRTHAMLWIARDEARIAHPFDNKFLGISDPYTDARVKTWDGFTQMAYFDADGRRVEEPVDGGSAKELVPLALYSLEYPKVPLLLVDFRRIHAPKRREMMRRATTDAIVGVLGISRWGNWPYMAGSWAYSFIRSRQGDTNNRIARLKSFSQARRWLAMDHSIEPHFKAELLRRLEVLGVNPVQESIAEEGDIGQRQYAALLRYAADPKGLPARLESDRQAERTSYAHGWQARAGLTTARVLTLGAYRHTEPQPQSLLAALDLRRRAQRRIRLLETVALNGAQAEDLWDLKEIRSAYEDVAAAGIKKPVLNAVEQILRQSSLSTTNPAPDPDTSSTHALQP